MPTTHYSNRRIALGRERNQYSFRCNTSADAQRKAPANASDANTVIHGMGPPSG